VDLVRDRSNRINFPSGTTVRVCSEASSYAMATHLTLHRPACAVTVPHSPARVASHAGRGGWDGPSHPSARPERDVKLLSDGSVT
jgi:hypothetical protein